MSGPTLSPAISRVILTGFMGAGKTTVGALLAARLGWDFVDSDRVVEARTGRRIAGIFEQDGEQAFRAMEAAAVRDLVSAERLVLALGGGALETAATRDLLASLSSTLRVFLEAPLETMVARCSAEADGAIRPVLADRERLTQRWEARLPWYRQAHLTIQTADFGPEQVVEQILRLAARGVPGTGEPEACASKRGVSV